MSGADPGIQLRGGAMASALREPVMGVWAPQWGPGAEPLVRESQVKPPLKLKDIHFFDGLRRAKFGLLSMIFR